MKSLVLQTKRGKWKAKDHSCTTDRLRSQLWGGRRTTVEVSSQQDKWIDDIKKYL
jgi:hypothetical protein